MLAVVMLTSLLALIALTLTGWRAFVIESPSMGRAAPVGTLVIDRPVHGDVIRVGDVVTYRPPGFAAETYTHRVISSSALGIRTKGDLNGSADPWLTPVRNVVGKAVGIVPGAGWLLRMAPWAGHGIGAVWVLTRFIRSSTWRSGARLVGLSIVVGGIVAVMHPLANSVVISSLPVGGHVEADVVSTGVLPIRIRLTEGAVVDLASGEMRRLSIPASGAGRFMFTTVLHLDPVGWVLLALVWMLPLAWILVVGLPADSSGRSP
ncbi:MAG: signal peptidase I [Actinomycetota bacterium]|nr:signal peptidase I [Actinomycetota bacterium]